MIKHTNMQGVEWIVLDNASKDGTSKEVLNRFHNVRLIVNDENIGFSRANNLGIKLSQGEYLFLINPDVEFIDDCIGKICQFMDENPDVAMCGPRILNSDGTLQFSCRNLPSIWNHLCFAFGLHRIFPQKKWSCNELMSWFDHTSSKDVEAISGCFLTIRRAILNDVGLMDERYFMYSEDVDWCKRFREKSKRIVFFPKTEAIHHGGKSAETISVQSSIAKTRAKLQYWRKHSSPSNSAIIRGVLFIRQLRLVAHALWLFSQGKRIGAQKKLSSAIACIKFLLQPQN